jgi:hypothetical protein
MAKKQTRSRAEQRTHPLLEKFAEVPVPPQGLFAYAVKIVCGKQTGENCTRPRSTFKISISRTRWGCEVRPTLDQMERRCCP